MEPQARYDRAHRTVLIGGGALAAELAQVLIQHRRYGLVPVGYVDDDAGGIASVVLPRLGGLDDLDLCVTRERADVTQHPHQVRDRGRVLRLAEAGVLDAEGGADPVA